MKNKIKIFFKFKKNEIFIIFFNLIIKILNKKNIK